MDIQALNEKLRKNMNIWKFDVTFFATHDKILSKDYKISYLYNNYGDNQDKWLYLYFFLSKQIKKK